MLPARKWSVPCDFVLATHERHCVPSTAVWLWTVAVKRWQSWYWKSYYWRGIDRHLLKEIVANIELLCTRGKCFSVSCSVCKQQRGPLHAKLQHWGIVDFNVFLLRFNKLVHSLDACIKYKGLKDNNMCVSQMLNVQCFYFISNPVLPYFRVRLLQHKSFA